MQSDSRYSIIHLSLNHDFISFEIAYEQFSTQPIRSKNFLPYLHRTSSSDLAAPLGRSGQAGVRNQERRAAEEAQAARAGRAGRTQDADNQKTHQSRR